MKQLFTIVATVALIIGVTLPAAAINPVGDTSSGAVAFAAVATPVNADDDSQDLTLDVSAAGATAVETDARDTFKSVPKPKPKPKPVIANMSALAGAYSGPIPNEWKGMMSNLPVNGATIGERFATYAGYFHDGIDFLAPGGTPIHATAAGTVVQVGWMGTMGVMVLIDHGSGIQSIYGHMLAGSPIVKPGEHVKAGQVIGKVGQTGTATTTHCHYGVRVNGQITNPAPFLGL